MAEYKTVWDELMIHVHVKKVGVTIKTIDGGSFSGEVICVDNGIATVLIKASGQIEFVNMQYIVSVREI